MKTSKKYLFIAFTALIALAFVQPAYAAVSLEKNTSAEFASTPGLFKGTLVVTYPDGRIVILEPGDPIPAFENGTSIEVFDGHFTISTEEGDSVSIGCLGASFGVSNGGSATVSCGQDTGKMIVQDGFATQTDVNGQLLTFRSPDVVPITLEGTGLDALPTAQTQPTGFGVEGQGDPDSTSIEPQPDLPNPVTPST